MSSTKKQMSVLFDPNEFVCAAMDAMGTRLYPVERVDDWAAFFSLNPFKRGTRRKDANVACYRNFLVEFDEVPLEQQLRFFDENRHLFASIVYSGGKSYHGVISLSDPLNGKLAYKALFKRLLKVTKCDPNNSNPSRFSRVAGHHRDDTLSDQSLYAVGNRIAVKDLDSWLSERGAPHVEILPRRAPILRMEGGKFPLSARTWRFLHQGAESGQSHKQCLLAAFDMLECNYTRDEALQNLQSAPWPSVEEGEIERILEHVYNEH